MRFILILSFFFSSVLDACLAEEILQSVASTVGIESTESHSQNATFVSTKCSDGDHSSHNESGQHDSCRHCHNCHTATPQTVTVRTSATDFTAQSPYAFFMPAPHYKTLKRPPKA